MANLKVKILAGNYQRNGISGVGFYSADIILFEDGNKIRLFATFETDLQDEIIIDRTRVTNPNNIYDCYRGDTIGHLLDVEIERLKKILNVDRIYKVFEKLSEVN